ncbi:Omp28-related outer membrane protein [Oscillospiraceae bacterium N12]|jgi:hypothetical protein|uniref:Omp28-related outer membrane protein n=1 Tax=Jilunia laotingensis TaxID=2763675 RepID=A0A926F755_9BACT|nr:Omp28-related outer membrane protein [Jilunia laotingensis]MBC8593094.1 Omp28-related outer membrane protein [Jilunia laotingensis]
MKYKYLLLVIGILWNSSVVCAQWRSASQESVKQQSEVDKIVKDQGDGKVLYGYCSPSAKVNSGSGIGFQLNKNTEVTAAIRFSEGVMSVVKGRKIYRLRIGVASKADDAKVFIRKPDGTLVMEMSATLNLGWNDVVLDTPVTIPEEKELYIGYRCTQYPGEYVIAYENTTAKANGTLMALGNGILWEYSDLGNLCILVELEGTEDEFNCLGSILGVFPSESYLPQGLKKKVEMVIRFLNEGEKEVTNIKLGRKYNGKELADTICAFHNKVRANNKSELTLEVIPVETSKYEYTLKEINGNPVSASIKETGISLYDTEDVVHRVVLIEEFTSQACRNCPAGQESLHKMISGNEDNVAMVLHHSGFAPDIFSIMESDGYCYFYGSPSTYAPAMVMDRTYLSLYDTDGTGSLAFDPRSLSKSTLLKELKLPAMVSVGIKSKYDDASRKLTVTVSGHKITDLVGEHVGLTVFLLESKYVGNQSGFSGEFEHNNFPRAVLSDATGDVITFNGDGTYSKEYVYTIPESYTSTTGQVTESHPENMNVVAFVSNYNNVYPDFCAVLNANKTTSLNEEVTGLKSERATDQSIRAFAKDGTVYVYGEHSNLKVYNLQGMPVPNENLVPGVYMVRLTGSNQKEYVRKVCVGN